jgi:hypothetical protein
LSRKLGVTICGLKAGFKKSPSPALLCPIATKIAKN